MMGLREQLLKELLPGLNALGFDEPMAKNPLRFNAGNYVSRVDDACFVEIGEATVYFAGHKVIAMAASDVIYRVNELDSGIVYKRLRAAVQRHKAKKVHQMKRDELHAMVEAAIMTMASKLVDDRLK
jgi:hypothetical protein